MRLISQKKKKRKALCVTFFLLLHFSSSILHSYKIQLAIEVNDKHNIILFLATTIKLKNGKKEKTEFINFTRDFG